MLEIIFFTLIISFCAYTKKHNIIYLLVFLLPFHTCIKHLFHYFFAGGGLFSAWKEVAIVILIYKTIKGKTYTLSANIKHSVVFFFALVILYFLLAPDYGTAMAVLRDHTFPVMLFMTIAICPVDEQVIKKMIMLICLACFINCVLGVVQNFFLKSTFAIVMERVDFIDNGGYIQYKTNSARIAGFERMAGVLGGPNDYGVYISFVFAALTGVLFSNLKVLLSKWQLRFIYLTLGFSVFCILFSFSRAGWAICAISFGITLLLNKVKVSPALVIGLPLFVLILSGVVVSYFPKVEDIITNTFNGDEASVANRETSFTTGLNDDLTEPLGHGLGSTDQRTGNNTHFVESAFMNIGYEIGLFGLAYLIFFHAVIIRLLMRAKNIRINPIAASATGLSAAALIACFVSVNPYGMPFIYMWWLMLGFGLNQYFILKVKDEVNKNQLMPAMAN